MRAQIFLAYHTQDDIWRERFVTMFTPLIRIGVSCWDETQILPGQHRQAAMASALKNACAIVLLVSPAFLATQLTIDQELSTLLTYSPQEQPRDVLWVPVRPCLWKQTALADYQAVHDASRPLSTLSDSDADKALVSICQRIYASVIAKSAALLGIPVLSELVFAGKSVSHENASLQKTVPYSSQSNDAVISNVLAMLIMDRSASMNKFGDIPLRAINDYLQRLRESEHVDLLEVSVVIFDHETEVLVPMMPISEIQFIQPYGQGRGTRLHGTVADSLNQLIEIIHQKQRFGKRNSVSVAVFTDGEDMSNPPGKYLERLRDAVSTAISLRFQLIAIGIGIDGNELARNLGFPLDLAITANPNGLEIMNAAKSASGLVASLSNADNPPHIREKSTEMNRVFPSSKGK